LSSSVDPGEAAKGGGGGEQVKRRPARNQKLDPPNQPAAAAAAAAKHCQTRKIVRSAISRAKMWPTAENPLPSVVQKLKKGEANLREEHHAVASCVPSLPYNIALNCYMHSCTQWHALKRTNVTLKPAVTHDNGAKTAIFIALLIAH
jgi:hypothetical protein